MPRKSKSSSSASSSFATGVDAYLDMLGTVPDGEIAAMAGVNESEVAGAREARGVPAHTPHPLMQYLDQFGKVSDDAIGVQAGVSRGTVGNFRRTMRLPSYRGHLSAQTGVKRPKAASPKVEAVAPEAVAGGTRLAAFTHLIGVLRDSAVAELAGMSAESVRLYRVKRNIPAGKARNLGETGAEVSVAAASPASASAPAPRKRGRPSNASRAAAALAAGTVFPAVAAPAVPPRKRGRPSNASRAAANSLAAAQAAAVASLRAAAAAPVVLPPLVVLAPVVVAAPSVASTTFAWSVLCRSGSDERRFVILGRDVGEASVRALAALRSRGGDWRVVKLKELAEAIE